MFGGCCTEELTEPVNVVVGMPMRPANMLFTEALKLIETWRVSPLLPGSG